MVVSALDSGSKGPWPDHCVVFLDKTLYSHRATQEYKWVPANCQEPDEMLGLTCDGLLFLHDFGSFNCCFLSKREQAGLAELGPLDKSDSQRFSGGNL